MENGPSALFLSPHTSYGRVTLARFQRVTLLRRSLPISLLILPKNRLFLQPMRGSVRGRNRPKDGRCIDYIRKPVSASQSMQPREKGPQKSSTTPIL